ncbi:hypothetical protein PSTG_03895 [Puccinia striiformis f. sp. tritici PST-78]|uniref:Tc1-like transposase DDE domain-containing protein n=1 Tax=Puccinia striiformis f. sp. tritici PST-78 TaxID=1165861 RepID=A0A0L0VUJ8_9BASI|nr:hypothetical protein PSTG_03895 [Puccinia striiformis f. sp. tritici PST-78]
MRYVPAEFLVFIDESAVCDRDLLRKFARSDCGKPSSRFIVRQNPESLSMLPAISISGILAMTVRDDTFNAKKFEHFLEHDLLPRMNKYPDVNSVLVCDNAAIHRRPRVAQLCADAGVRLVYLPPYCPELNPIELCFAAVKLHLQITQLMTRTVDANWDLRKTCAKIITPDLCYSLYRHCGYLVPSEAE